MRKFFDRVVDQAIVAGLVSDDHFSVAGTLSESCASIKSLRPIQSPDRKVSAEQSHSACTEMPL